MARLKDKYRAEVVPALQQRFAYKNVMEIPRLEKIVINMGLGDCTLLTVRSFSHNHLSRDSKPS